ncbi:MAG: hypothetical protein M1269_05210 [Chloroflexi bacterium]|nr:hypothetical protein [Chloroflexota bacterium]
MLYYDPDRYADWPGGRIKKKAEKSRKPTRFPRICATCRHLKVLETGREFAAIIDTEYTLFSCSKLGWETKEFYLMKTDIDIAEYTSSQEECPHWEPWYEDIEKDHGTGQE